MEEVWRNIIGFEGHYQVSNYGRIKNMNYHNSGQAVIIKTITTEKGYIKVELNNGVKKKKYFVHRIVARAFPEICGEWFDGAVVNHKDCTTSNNIATNLEVCTVDYNNRYGERNKKISSKMLNGKNSIPIVQLSLNSTFIKQWPSAMEVQRIKNYYQGHISKCCKGSLKTAYGFKWMYADEYYK